MQGTVLIADEDRAIRTALTQTLTRAGCKVHATARLRTLMRWVAEGRGDVIVIDVVTSDGDGLELLPEIARLRPGLPVIVISALDPATEGTGGAGPWDYLPKPFDLPDLMHRTARALRGHASAVPPDAVADTEAGAERLADSVARHLRRYFDLHGTMLPAPGLYGRILREIETPLIEVALEATAGNQAKCAELLGINRNTLRKKITDLDIQVTRQRKMM